MSKRRTTKTKRKSVTPTERQSDKKRGAKTPSKATPKPAAKSTPKRGRPRVDPQAIADALDMRHREDLSIAEVSRRTGITTRVLYRAEKLAGPRAPDAVRDALKGFPPPTAEDRKLDRLLVGSSLWRRLQAVIAGALAEHPEAAESVAKALRVIDLGKA
jgi:hypothetical protein